MLPYLLASLPTFALGARPTLTTEAFLEACGRVLDARRLAALARAVGVAAAPTAAQHAPAEERAWGVLDARIEDAVVRARCARAQRDPTPFLRHPPGLRLDVEEAVARAFATPHPGVRERALDELRWRLADELARTAPDGFAALFARAVQLRLASRWAAWDTEAGWRVLEADLRSVDAAAEAHGADGFGAGSGNAAGAVHDA
jgi:hypothetical protein